MQTLSYREIEQKRQSTEESVERSRERLRILAQIDPEGNKVKMEKTARRLQKEEETLATYNTAVKISKQRGEGWEESYMGGEKLIGNIAKEERLKQIKVEASTKSKNTATEELAETTNSVKEAFRELEKALKDSTKTEAQKTAEQKKFDKVSDAYSKAREIAREKGVDPSEPSKGFFQKMGGWTGAIRTAGVALQELGTTERFMDVILPMKKMEAQLGYAELSNRRTFDKYNSLENNDVAAMRRLSGGWDAASKVGQKMRWAEQASLFFETAGTGIVLGTDTWNNYKTGNWDTATQNAIRGAGNLYRMEETFRSGVPGAQAGIAGEQMRIQLFDTVSKVSNYNRQRMVDYGYSSADATLGAGTRRGQSIRDLWQFGQATGPYADQSPISVRDLTRVGMSLEDIKTGTAQGIGAMGAQYNRNATLQSARHAEISGVMSATQFIGMSGQLSNLGAKSDEKLEDIIANAMELDLDTSKNIVQMVQGISSISQASAARGLDVIGGAANIMANTMGGNTMGGLADYGVAENMRAGAAQTALAQANALMSSDQNSMVNVARVGMLRQKFGNLSINTMESAMTTPIEIYEEIVRLQREGKGEEAAMLAVTKGLGGILVDRDEEGKMTGVNLGKATELKDFIQESIRWGTTGFAKPRLTAEESELVDQFYKDPTINFKDLPANVQNEIGGAMNVAGQGFGVSELSRGIGKEAQTKYRYRFDLSKEENLLLENKIRQAETGRKITEAGMVDNDLTYGGVITKDMEFFGEQQAQQYAALNPVQEGKNAQETSDRFESPSTKIENAANVFERAVEVFAAVQKFETPSVKEAKEKSIEAEKAAQIDRINKATELYDSMKEQRSPGYVKANYMNR
jgi:hypothetical protein